LQARTAPASAALLENDLVDVQSEIAYWKQRLNTQVLMDENFSNECEPLVKLACDVYLRNPHGSRTSWVEELRMRVPHPGRSKGMDFSVQIADLCWDRLRP